VAQVRDGESIPRQVEMIRRYCRDKGLSEPEIITDEGISGFKATRPGYQRLQQQCRSGSVTHVIITDLSRLSRSVRDTLAFVDEIVQQRGVRLVCLTLDLDTGTPFGRAFLTFVAVFAQLYRDEISFKTKVALAFKKSKGERYSGAVPYGYVDDGSGRLVESEQDATTITLVAELRAGGLSLRQIARSLAERGIKTKTGKDAWSAKTIRDLLAKSVTDRGSDADRYAKDHDKHPSTGGDTPKRDRGRL